MKWIVVMRGEDKQTGQRRMLNLESHEFTWENGYVQFWNPTPGESLGIDVVLALNADEVLSVAPAPREEEPKQ